MKTYTFVIAGTYITKSFQAISEQSAHNMAKIWAKTIKPGLRVKKL